jgi:SUR7/PalI family
MSWKSCLATQTNVSSSLKVCIILRPICICIVSTSLLTCLVYSSDLLPSLLCHHLALGGPPHRNGCSYVNHLPASASTQRFQPFPTSNFTPGPILGLSSLIILAGGILLQFLVILSGGVNGNPENQIYFLEVSNIGNIPNVRNPSRWTFFAVCGVDLNGRNANCGAPVPALPFDPPRNFHTQTNVPQQFIGYVSNSYQLMWI